MEDGEDLQDGCEWAPYKLNNGDIEGTVDLTIRNDYDDVSKKIIVQVEFRWPVVSITFL